ncbi:MAG: lysophospholipid acyltransferase family protein [Pseudomonadota bacterium]
MNKLRHAFYQPYKFLVYIPAMVASTAASWAVVTAVTPFAGADETSVRVGGAWGRFNARITPMTVEVLGRENIRPGQSYVICSNHQSHFDIFLLYGWLGLDFKWVMKQELRKIPFLGHACEQLGHIFIDRSNHEKAVASINAAKEKIVNGKAVLFFPEGTRSMDGKLGPFKKGAFRMALDLGLPILPVTIQGTRDVLPPGTMDLQPGHAKMIIHPEVPTTDYSSRTMKKFVDKVREIIQQGLDTGKPAKE